ncbi:hypothetical protein MNB_SUP05-SYMBIONT-7-180 [hydrothermal vent metagenome]|uniref:Uncharacterized protein n=1 Tax=hydrothermal vent metagenome TaxID=652676 RepID=A0A1W1E494_9ZZZZ
MPSILDIMGMTAHKNINGKSLLNTINPKRLRVNSQYMPTQHNEPKAVLAEPDLRLWSLDFEKMSVTYPDGKKTIRFKDWEERYQRIFLDKLPN